MGDSIYYQAVCDDCDFSGDKRSLKSDAYDDALAHKAELGKQNHTVNVITTTTKKPRFLSFIHRGK